MFHPRFKPPCRDGRYTRCGPSPCVQHKNLLHGSFHNNLRQQPFAAFVGVRGKEAPFRARKHRLRANVRFCAYHLQWLVVYRYRGKTKHVDDLMEINHAYSQQYIGLIWFHGNFLNENLGLAINNRGFSEPKLVAKTRRGNP